MSARSQTARAEQDAETDMHSEYARQREHLERSVASLRKKMAKDTEIHRSDTIRVMQVRGGIGNAEPFVIHLYISCSSDVYSQENARSLCKTCI